MVMDARTYRIPNMCVLFLAGMGVVLFAIYAPSELLTHGAVAAAALAIGFLLFRLIGLGAGDAKFIAAILIWFGLSKLVSFFFWFGVSSGILTMTLLAGRQISAHSNKTLFNWRPLQKGEPVPFALAIGPAAIITGMP